MTACKKKQLLNIKYSSLAQSTDKNKFCTLMTNDSRSAEDDIY